jgi:hypothetical protein
LHFGHVFDLLTFSFLIQLHSMHQTRQRKVCEMADKLMIRSYFSNKRTHERQWDEPPSGASHVIHASETMRHMAKAQLQEMQIAMGAVPDTEKKETPTPKKGGGFGGFFRRSKVEENSAERLAPEKRIQYKPDSFLARTKKESKKQQKYDDMLDPAMQRALVSSMACKSRSMDYHDAELERALALSLGETQGRSTDRMSQGGASEERCGSKDGLGYRQSGSREGSAHKTSRSREGSTHQVNTSKEASAHRTRTSREASSHPRNTSSETSVHRRSASSDALARRRRTSRETSAQQRSASREVSRHQRSASRDSVREGRSPYRRRPLGDQTRHRSSSREQHIDKSKHRAGSVTQRNNPGDHSGHRFPSRTQLLCDGLADHRPPGPERPVENPRPDPPSDLDPYGSYDLDDGSIVHFEFSHDEDEALAMAMRLSLLDVTSQVPEAAASIPEVSEMTEDVQLSLALTESLAMAPPELKMNQNESFPPTSSDDADDRKLPAKRLESTLQQSRSAGGGEGRNSAFGDFKSSTYIVSLKDASASPGRRKPPSRDNSLRQLHSQTRGNEPGYKTAPAPTCRTSPPGGSRSMSPALRESLPQDGSSVPNLSPGTTPSGEIRQDRNSQSRRQGEFDIQREKPMEEKRMLQVAIMENLNGQSKSSSTESKGSHGGSNHRRRHERITHEEVRLRQEEQMLQEALRVSLNEHALSLNEF